MYEELVKRLRILSGTDNISEFDEAADAIEELAKDLERSKEYETFWNKEAEEALRRFQVAVANKPRWIPVTERLPDVDEKVLTFARNKYDGSWFVDITSWTGIRNHDEYQFWGYGDSMKVTHWMPLPEPPKEGE